MRKDHGSLYAEVTDRIIAELEQGRLPWVQPWDSGKAAIGLPPGSPAISFGPFRSNCYPPMGRRSRQAEVSRLLRGTPESNSGTGVPPLQGRLRVRWFCYRAGTAGQHNAQTYQPACVPQIGDYECPVVARRHFPVRPAHSAHNSHGRLFRPMAEQVPRKERFSSLKQGVRSSRQVPKKLALDAHTLRGRVVSENQPDIQRRHRRNPTPTLGPRH